MGGSMPLGSGSEVSKVSLHLRFSTSVSCLEFEV